MANGETQERQDDRLQRVLPDGGSFGSREDDEFFMEMDGKNVGVFKRFEYNSVPFSITGNDEKLRDLVEEAKRAGITVQEVISRDPLATRIVNDVTRRMDANPVFSRQVLDTLLAEAYVADNVLAAVEVGDSLENYLAKVALAWDTLADFYCIEGLVGGQGEHNPFECGGSSSLVAGGLDSLETDLPTIKRRVGSDEWKAACLALSSVVGRDYRQIERAVDVLGSLHGTERDLTNEEVEDGLRLIKELPMTVLERNCDVGKFYNAFIRFHNWLSLAIKAGGPEGDTYDSICVPARKAVCLSGNGWAECLSQITDATSPKGLALLSLVDEGKIGNKEVLVRELRKLERRMQKSSADDRGTFSRIELDDYVFYPGLVGGKWKGVKLLYDAKNVFGLTYGVPEGFDVPSIEVRRFLKEKGVLDIVYENIFSLSDARRNAVSDAINRIDFDRLIDVESLGDNLVVRSTMYGEDGTSNFSGTYDSVRCNSKAVGNAAKTVTLSYFSSEAVQSREERGLAHIPGISLIVQRYVEGEGGVLYLTGSGHSISLAASPDDAVQGNGSFKTADDIDSLVRQTPLQEIRHDLEVLYRVFGNSDIEFVVAADGVYLTQLRSKYQPPRPLDSLPDAERITFQRQEELAGTTLDGRRIVRMDFLGKVPTDVAGVMAYIRRNKGHIAAVEGYLPSTAHVPNKIEGHFRIPYVFLGERV